MTLAAQWLCGSALLGLPVPSDAAGIVDQFLRVASLRDYNTRVVLLGTTLLGVSAGVVGTFMLLRRRSLMGDVVAHASLPGVALAFIVLEAVSPGMGRSLTALLAGAVLAGFLGILATVAIRRYTRIKEDAALAIVLSVFFGLGIALFTVVQNLPTGNAAGLHHFIYGKAASMVADHVRFIAAASALVLTLCLLFFKEFTVLAFDEQYAAAQGWPVLRLDVLLLALVVGVTVIGLQSVGLLLVVAMLIIPAAAARFWTDRLGWMTMVSGLLGGLGAAAGVAASAIFPRLAAGAVIVLASSFFFLVSMLFGIRRGVLVQAFALRRSRRRVGRHDLLRAMYENVESSVETDGSPEGLDLTAQPVAFDRLLATRSWSAARVRRLLAAAQREGLVTGNASSGYRLTARGAADARRVVRNHRLWEMYLITYADVATSHIDRDADEIEYVLDPDLVAELETALSRRRADLAMPASPHAIQEDSACHG
ncbi:MAG: metal ABC transporter permease [Pirellulales bacterium]|nr:metal ABC transporter permease [Pirellulales bacterium]